MTIKQATIYNAISKYTTMVVQIVLSMILSRLIVPKAFGVIQIVLVVQNFLYLFADMGLGVAIIQHPDMEEKRQQELFGFSIFTGVILLGIMLLLAFPISAIYHNSIYYRIIPFLSVAAFFYACNIVPNAILVRDKRFDLIAVRSVLSTIVPGIVAVLLSFLGWGVYALVMQNVISALFIFVWNYASSPIRVSHFSFKQVAILMGGYSLFQFLFSVLNYFTRNVDSLIIGSKMGDIKLGYYSKAYSLNLYPNMIFTSVITGVLHPFLRDYKNDNNHLMKQLVRILTVLSIIGALVTVICYSCSEEIILLFFGMQWKPAVKCFQMLSICIWAQMLSSVSGSVFLGIERTDKVFECGVINLALILLAIIAGMSFNSIAIVSLFIGIAYNIIFFITYFILICRVMGKSYLDFLRNFVGEFIFIIIGISVTSFIPVISNVLIVELFIKVCLLSGAYGLYLLLSKRLWILVSFFSGIKNKG